MLEIKNRACKSIVKVYCNFAKLNKGLLSKNTGSGMGDVLAICGVIIIAALILIPGLKTFASGLITKLTTWWGTVETTVFSS